TTTVTLTATNGLTLFGANDLPARSLYISAMGSAYDILDETKVQLVMPAACVAQNLFVSNLSGVNDDRDFIVSKNTLPTALRCRNSTINCSNTADTVQYNAGDLVSIREIYYMGSGNRYSYSFQCK